MPDLSWSIPVMRAGYAGRGLVYLAVAGFSLFAIWHGGQANGTSSALGQLENTAAGSVVLVLIFLGMIAYAIWRASDAIFDLDDHGDGAKGLTARAAMVVSAVLHLAIAGVAFTLLFTGDDGGGGGSTLTSAVDAIMGLPAGRWMVGLTGLLVIAYGGYYIVKGWRETYRDRLVANHFTENWNPALKAGLMAKGIVIVIVGGLTIYAAWTADPQQAGGTGEALAWLTGQPYGRILVGLICVGLLGFALYCFVSAAYRFVPKTSFGSERTLGESLEARARSGAQVARAAAR